jgi:hypothetical protein
MAAQQQTGVHLARLACALERFHLAQGRYPDTLSQLAPQFLDRVPVDTVNGQPLKYRRDARAKYVLYSVGWDLNDDGGQPSATAGGTGDWVWRYPVIKQWGR